MMGEREDVVQLDKMMMNGEVPLVEGAPTSTQPIINILTTGNTLRASKYTQITPCNTGYRYNALCSK